jgi:hypothetical protein
MSPLPRSLSLPPAPSCCPPGPTSPSPACQPLAPASSRPAVLPCRSRAPAPARRVPPTVSVPCRSTSLNPTPSLPFFPPCGAEPWTPFFLSARATDPPIEPPPTSLPFSPRFFFSICSVRHRLPAHHRACPRRSPVGSPPRHPGVESPPHR